MPEISEVCQDVKIGSQSSADRPFHFIPPNQDDRLREVFGLSEESPIPPVTHDTLAAYHDYLAARLFFPFEALYCPNGSDMRQLIHYIKITGLIAPQPGRSRVLQGLLCLAENHREVLQAPLVEIGVREENPNCQLIDDYSYWFVNWQ